MSDANDTPTQASLHALRSALNGLLLQLEVARLAVAHADEARLLRALDLATTSGATAARELDALGKRLAESP